MASLANSPRERPYEPPPLDPLAGTRRSASPMGAVARHPFVAVLPVLIGLAVALAVGVTRQPVYSAQARLGIVSVNLETPGALGGFGTGASQLAQAYARTLAVPQIRSAVARRTRVQENLLDGRLSATAVPNAPIFSIRARAPTAANAVELANVTSQEVVRYVASINSTAARTDALLNRYTATQQNLQRLLARRDLLQRAYDRSHTSAVRRSLTDARAAAEVAKTRAAALQLAYQQSLTATDSGELVSVLARATNATSDRRSMIQLLAFLGLVAGAAAGLALALLLSARDSRRPVAEGVPVGRRRRIAYATAAGAVIAVAAGVALALTGAGWPH